jgi:hypothetical protein
MINYEALSLQCKAICGAATKEIAKIDELLNKINASASVSLNKGISDYETY